MADETQIAPASRKSHVAGGAVAGAGISTALFGTIGIAKILSSPGEYSTVYPVVIFCLAALFLLTAALMTVQINPQQRVFAYVGMACFACILLAGVAIIFAQDAVKHTVNVTETFEPADLMSNGGDPKLQILFHTTHNAQDEYAPYKSNTFPIISDDKIAFRVDGLAKLVSDYRNISYRSKIQAELLMNACKAGPPSVLCQNILVLNAPPQT